MCDEGVREFYSGQTVFLTGATGFVGRVIIEKLLRTCPNVKRLYLLIRTKKGKDSRQRIHEIFDDPVFELMKNENPDYKSKVTLIAGDLSIPDIGISESDRKTLIDEVTVVFHGGATVRFDAKLKTAININISGTKEILQICSECKNLKALVHISTAYANCNKDEIDELIYQPPISAENIIGLAQCMPDEVMERCTETIIQGWPNTYAFTKQIGEDLVKREAIAKNIPAAIYRPAIVVGAYNEPIPGWIDNVYGPTGFIAAVGIGLLRTFYANMELRAELVPIDMTVNGVLSVAWDVARKQKAMLRIGAIESDLPNNTVEAYNFVTARDNTFLWGDLRIYMERHGLKILSAKAIWYNIVFPTRYYALYVLYSFFLHLLPAFLIDCALLIAGRKPQMLQIYKKLNKFLNVIFYFCSKEWKFHSDNMNKLWSALSREDKILFNFDMKTLDWDRFFENNLKGIRVYILKDPLDTIPEGQRRMIRFRILHYSIVATVCLMMLWLFWTPIQILINWVGIVCLFFPHSETQLKAIENSSLSQVFPCI